jgi:hypothetical protein
MSRVNEADFNAHHPRDEEQITNDAGGAVGVIASTSSRKPAGAAQGGTSQRFFFFGFATGLHWHDPSGHLRLRHDFPRGRLVQAHGPQGWGIRLLFELTVVPGAS